MKNSVLFNFNFQSYLLNVVLKGSTLTFYHIQQKKIHFYVMGEEAMMYYNITNFKKILLNSPLLYK
jgi:hypothetical protein